MEDVDCRAAKHCPTVIMHGSMQSPSPPDPQSKTGTGLDFGSFTISSVNPHFLRLKNDEPKWKLTLVKPEQGQASVRSILLPVGTDNSPIKLCCNFAEGKKPSILCKDHDYLHNLQAGDVLHLVFGRMLASSVRLYNKLPAPGSFELEIQSSTCTAAAEAATVEFFSSKREAAHTTGMLARFFTDALANGSVTEKSTWEVVLARWDSRDRTEEPARLCCLLEEKNQKGGHQAGDTISMKRIHGKCLDHAVFRDLRAEKNLRAIDVYKATHRKPKRDRLAPQLKCLPLPLPTKQQWMQTAFPTPIPDE